MKTSGAMIEAYTQLRIADGHLRNVKAEWRFTVKYFSRIQRAWVPVGNWVGPA